MNTSPTEYEQELIKRNEHIYTKSLEGISNSELANMYHLSASSIRRSIIDQRKGYEAMNNKIRQIINEWDIEKKDVKQIYDSAWQIGEDYVLKTYEDVNIYLSLQHPAEFLPPVLMLPHHFLHIRQYEIPSLPSQVFS